MRIGLIRHFRVEHAGLGKRLVTQEELFQWIEEYDRAGVAAAEAEGCQGWRSCYTSDLPRALMTTRVIYDGEAVVTQRLREIPVYPLFHKSWRLPGWLWLPLLRIAWLCNHPSQLERKQEVESRIQSVLDDILQDGEDTLIVSHGALMVMMRRLLARRGFRGAKLRRPKNGVLYIFEL